VKGYLLMNNLLSLELFVTEQLVNIYNFFILEKSQWALGRLKLVPNCPIPHLKFNKFEIYITLQKYQKKKKIEMCVASFD
jgi:hypothetical protein